jgi:hypothetical protein
MRAYYYSATLLKYVRAGWLVARFVGAGVLVGFFLVLGLLKMNQSAASTIATGSDHALQIENGVLRHQIGLIAPRLIRLENQEDQLEERTKELHRLLQPRRNIADTVLSFTNLTSVLNQQSFVGASKNPRPWLNRSAGFPH